MNFYQTDKTYSRGDRVRFPDGSIGICVEPTSKNSKEDFRSEEMKLRDIQISFYKRCGCQGPDDIIIMTLREIARDGVPYCPECEKDYDFDEEADLWDTF